MPPEQFSNERGKTVTRLNTSTNHDRSKQSAEPIKIPRNYLEYNSLKTREKSRVQGAVGFSFASH